MQTREDIAGQLRALRRARGLTQRQLAERSGLEQGHISRIESAAYDPRIETLIALSAALNASLYIVPDEQGQNRDRSLLELPDEDPGDAPATGVSDLIAALRD